MLLNVPHDLLDDEGYGEPFPRQQLIEGNPQDWVDGGGGGSHCVEGGKGGRESKIREW